MTRLLLTALLIGMAFVPAHAFDPGARKDRAVIAASELPREGRDTLALIRKGGPFPYPAKDGSVFSNREKALPKQPRGHYREYTVKTPGSRDRGARRIVCGGKAQAECYYTDDHYRTFKLIKE
ncbi:MAG TPA: ribonuclease domain-containing protein [Usitatibacteraceae bacterium]|nr:ribonuclease domain-containing protein [Usitatibacteraceae bacterium]